MLNKIVLSLGSNKDQEKNIAEAGRRLSGCYDSICFSEPVYTEPIGICCTGLFLNQVAVAYVEQQPEEVITLLKSIESDLQRTPQGKAAGIVPIDIDLLQWNDRVLKPDDMERAYIVEGLHSLETNINS